MNKQLRFIHGFPRTVKSRHTIAVRQRPDGYAKQRIRGRGMVFKTKGIWCEFTTAWSGSASDLAHKANARCDLLADRLSRKYAYQFC